MRVQSQGIALRFQVTVQTKPRRVRRLVQGRTARDAGRGELPPRTLLCCVPAGPAVHALVVPGLPHQGADGRREKRWREWDFKSCRIAWNDHLAAIVSGDRVFQPEGVGDTGTEAAAGHRAPTRCPVPLTPVWPQEARADSGARAAVPAPLGHRRGCVCVTPRCAGKTAQVSMQRSKMRWQWPLGTPRLWDGVPCSVLLFRGSAMDSINP